MYWGSKIWDFNYSQVIEMVQASLLTNGFEIVVATELFEKANHSSGHLGGYRFVIDCNDIFKPHINKDEPLKIFPLFNVIVWQTNDNKAEVTALDPEQSMTEIQYRYFESNLIVLHKLLNRVITP